MPYSFRGDPDVEGGVVSHEAPMQHPVKYPNVGAKVTLRRSRLSAGWVLKSPKSAARATNKQSSNNSTAIEAPPTSPSLNTQDAASVPFPYS
jgi:hypothetical protein